jgi:hypothetical protein
LAYPGEGEMGFNRKFGLTAALWAAAGLAAAGTPGLAGAQIFLTPVDFRAGPIEASDPLVGGPLPGATPAEYRANLLWNFRAGLNVAALQCQFSPYLRVAANYNGLLVHHSKELAAAVTALNGYFKRTAGPVKGMKKFDDYSTIVYNGFSTLQGQMGFCQTASNIMKTALVTPKGELAGLALKRMRELRNSLIAAADPALPYNPYAIRLDGVPPLGEECWDRNDRLKPGCTSLTASLPPPGHS